MKINKVLLLIGAVLLTMYSFGQQTDSRLSAVYSADEIIKLKQSAPEAIEYFNFYVRNSYVITDFVADKPMDFEELHKINPRTKETLSDQITTGDLVDFNPYLFSCIPDMDKRKYYKVGDTGKLLIMLSRKEIEKKFRIENKTNR